MWKQSIPITHKNSVLKHTIPTSSTLIGISFLSNFVYGHIFLVVTLRLVRQCHLQLTRF